MTPLELESSHWARDYGGETDGTPLTPTYDSDEGGSLRRRTPSDSPPAEVLSQPPLAQAATTAPSAASTAATTACASALEVSASEAAVALAAERENLAAERDGAIVTKPAVSEGGFVDIIE